MVVGGVNLSTGGRVGVEVGGGGGGITLSAKGRVGLGEGGGSYPLSKGQGRAG